MRNISCIHKNFLRPLFYPAVPSFPVYFDTACWLLKRGFLYNPQFYMNRMVGCVVEIVSGVLWLCVYRSDQGGSLSNEQDVQKGDRIVRLDVCGKFDVYPQVFNLLAPE